MSMFKYILASFLLIGLLSSCQKDDEWLEPPTDPKIDQVMYRSDIFGVVFANDAPLNEVAVTFKDQTVFTDEDGVYSFTDVEVGSQHNVVKLSKAGYFDGARTFRSAGSSTQYQQTILLEKNFDNSFDSSEGDIISKDRATLSFPAQSIVVESSGELYTGEVQVAIEMIDPSLFNLSDIMPGDLTAREDDNSLRTLQSFGMVNVELQSPSGQKLQIAPGKTVDLSYTVNDAFLNDAPEIIDMWSFDFDLGLWEKEGEATLEGNIYTGSVSHFSCWNYDVSAPSVVVNGKLISNQMDLEYFRVTILNADNKGGRGWTDSEGKFSGRVEAGVPLTLKIYANSNCWNQNADPIYEQAVGPLDVDTDLGTYTVNVDDIDFLILKGTAVDCSGVPLQEGRVVFTGAINYLSYPIKDGVIDLAIPVCSSSPVNVKIVDPITVLQTFEMSIPAPGETDLMVVSVCDEMADFMSVDNLLQGQFNLVDSLSFYSYTTQVDEQVGQILAYLIDDIISVDISLGFYMGNAFAMEELEEKTYDITSYSADYGDDIGVKENYRMLTGQMGQITIESIQTISSDLKQVTGMYTVDCTEDSTGALRTLTGSFNLEYNN